MASRELGSDAFVDEVADVICRCGLRLPALVGLEAARPLSFLGGQLLWIAQPTLGILVGRDLVGQLAHLLEDSATVDALISRLEASGR